MTRRGSSDGAVERKCRIRVGTSGYSYPEWIAAGVYPPGTSRGRMLAAYGERFPTTELNYTWYQMPKAETVERMLTQVPAGFCFAAKLIRTLTHEVDSGQWRGEAARYRDGIAPLILSGRLAAVLIQLPPYFNRSPAYRHYLASLLDALEGLPLAVEFRHGSWATDRVFSELERRRVTLVAVDTPDIPGLFPRLDVVTHPELFYVRFHGRNARGWRSGHMQHQFDYDYSDDELNEWASVRIAPMSRQTRRGVIFFNNHVRGQAPENARRLMAILDSQKLLEQTPCIDPSFT
ncbi:MAG: DUF72 domain-containing protein [Desulfobacterales bacterium]|jgi:uncharacterized protein YecE (DUF72 family)